MNHVFFLPIPNVYIHFQHPRKHSSRMYNTHLRLPPDVNTSGGGLKWTSLNRSLVMTTRCHWQGDGVVGGPMSGRELYSEVQCIIGNGHMGPPIHRLTNRHDWKHYLPAPSLAGGKNQAWDEQNRRLIPYHFVSIQLCPLLDVSKYWKQFSSGL